MKKLLVLLLCVIMVACTGCSIKSHDAEDTLYKLRNINSYSAKVSINVYNSKQTVNISGNQYFLKAIGQRQDISEDRIYIYKGGKLYGQDLKSGNSFASDTNDESIIKNSFISEFVKLLYTDEKINISYAEESSIKYEVISLTIPGNLRSMASSKLYVDKKTMNPVKMIIYDTNDKETVVITYSDFQYNAKLDSKIFDTK